MSRVKLKDVVMRVKDKVDKDNTELKFYVGGEHIDGNEICVTKRGIIQGSTIGPAFHMAFKAGDVLLMSRNPHLRKASMVDFDGICSDVSYVCRTKDESVLLQSYLPFLLQSDDFWRFAEENKKGGLPFFLNWSDFERYEFELPSIEKQRELSDLLWAMQRTKQAYQELLAKTDELVKSQFIEMFGDYVNQPIRWDCRKLQELIELGWITYHLDGNHGGDYPRSEEFVKNGVSYISANCIVDGRIDFTNAKYVTEERSKRFRKGIAQNRDVLFAHNATVGPVAILETQDPIVILGTSLTAYRCNTEKLLPEYLKTYLECDYFVRQYEAEMQQSTRKQVPITTQRKYTVVVPKIESQKQFVTFIEQTDKSKFELKQNIENINSLMRSLMRQDFTN